MPDRQPAPEPPDESTEALRAVQLATGTDGESYNAEEDVGSPELARQLREAKERERLRSQKLHK